MVLSPWFVAGLETACCPLARRSGQEGQGWHNAPSEAYGMEKCCSTSMDTWQACCDAEIAATLELLLAQLAFDDVASTVGALGEGSW